MSPCSSTTSPIKLDSPFGGGLVFGCFANLLGVKRFFFLSAALGYPQAAHEKEQPHAETTYDEVTHTNSWVGLEGGVRFKGGAPKGVDT
jgi:hypothetical protein